MSDIRVLYIAKCISKEKGQMFHPNAISNAKSGELLIQTERRENNVCLEQTHANVI